MWVHGADIDPKTIGWYPVVLCWDSQEGSFMGARYWNGTEWENSSGITSYYDLTFETKNKAEEFAKKHDISW